MTWSRPAPRQEQEQRRVCRERSLSPREVEGSKNPLCEQVRRVSPRGCRPIEGREPRPGLQLSPSDTRNAQNLRVCSAFQYRHGDSNGGTRPFPKRFPLAGAVGPTAMDRSRPLSAGADFPPTFPRGIAPLHWALGARQRDARLWGASLLPARRAGTSRRSQSSTRFGRVRGGGIHVAGRRSAPPSLGRAVSALRGLSRAISPTESTRPGR